MTAKQYENIYDYWSLDIKALGELNFDTMQYLEGPQMTWETLCYLVPVRKCIYHFWQLWFQDLDCECTALES